MVICISCKSDQDWVVFYPVEEDRATGNLIEVRTIDSKFEKSLYTILRDYNVDFTVKNDTIYVKYELYKDQELLSLIHI